MTPREGSKGPPPPPPSSRCSGLFLWARTPSLRSSASPPPPRASPRAGRPSPCPPGPSPGHVLALPSGRGRGRRGVPEDGAEENARGPAPLSSLPVAAPRRRAALPSPGPAPARGRPLPPTRTPRLAAGAPGLGPPRREGFAGRAGGKQRGREEGRRPPPVPLLLPLLRGRPVPPPAASLRPPPSLCKTSRPGPAAAATFPAGAADVAERPGAGRPCQGSPRPVSLAPGPPPAPAPPPLSTRCPPTAGARSREHDRPRCRGKKPPGVVPWGRRPGWGTRLSRGGCGARGSPPPPASRPGPL